MVAIITGRVPRHTQRLHRARTVARAPSYTRLVVQTQPHAWCMPNTKSSSVGQPCKWGTSWGVSRDTRSPPALPLRRNTHFGFGNVYWELLWYHVPGTALGTLAYAKGRQRFDPWYFVHMCELCSSFYSTVWCGVVWCGVVWCGVVWCGVVWCGVVWCGVVWCGVVWCPAMGDMAHSCGKILRGLMMDQETDLSGAWSHVQLYISGTRSIAKVP